MDFEKQEELRTKYALIRRGLSALRHAIEGLTLAKLTGDPLFDDSKEGRQKLIMIVEKAAHRATQSEIDALIAEYGPDAGSAVILAIGSAHVSTASNACASWRSAVSKPSVNQR